MVPWQSGGIGWWKNAGRKVIFSHKFTLYGLVLRIMSKCAVFTPSRGGLCRGIKFSTGFKKTRVNNDA